jgi:cytochrome c oxidase subunit II
MHDDASPAPTGVHIHVYERIVLGVTALLLLAAMGALAGSFFGSHIHLPGPVGTYDPSTLRQTPPFDAPGLHDLGGGRYEAIMVAQTWAFAPNEIRVPVGANVTFRVASADVTHGFIIEKTDANLTLIPGQIAETSATFREPGTYLFLCHEYCGIGHQTMYGRVVVQ